MNTKFKTEKKVPICISIHPKIKKELQLFASSEDCSKSDIAEQALVDFLKKKKKLATA